MTGMTRDVGFSEELEMFMHIMSPAIGMARLHPEKAKEYLDAACDEMSAWQYARNPKLAAIMPDLEDAAKRHALTEKKEG